ncbi:hypothetical protein [Chitinophaga rhizophila]|uniref:Uncharacterized protein n=1 Tax=Chitinophaga rhizophila TaxID=2866212 RepID=A0ABS7GJA3_9BACT|nr:hypothetical protein [Chitinophaga rhizophila]MBW8687376.1 hypothetical protein [Chitinophaga rhizophila]
MRKQLITFLLTLIWLSQLSGRYLVMFEFYLNQEFIAKNLCINRDKPQVQCNGKCQLKKQLAKENKREQENPEQRAELKAEIFYPSVTECLVPVAYYTSVPATYNIPTTIGVPIDQASAIFQPPCV